MKIEERIERGREIMENEILTQVEEAQKEIERILKAWDSALADICTHLPEDIADAGYLHVPDPRQRPGCSAQDYINLLIPRLAPIRIYVDFVSSGSGGYVVRGLEKYPYRVGCYYPGWKDDVIRVIETHWDDTRIGNLDVALYMAADEEANLPSVQKNKSPTPRRSYSICSLPMPSHLTRR
jgi:hypothetical protein